MSKKELVKNVIEELIDKGKDFHEITQGTLAHVKELENISKTTIKRAKNEYKKEKIVVKQNYKETLIKRKIYKYLDRYPKTTLSELREALPEIPPNKVSEYHLYWTRKREKAKTNRTQKRVMVNPRKLKEMVFNYLNTNEEAVCEDLFKAFPEANRSSVTSYFGHWKKKRASHEKGKEGSLYHVIFRFLDGHPESTIKDLQLSFKDVPSRSLEVYHNLWQKKQQELQISQSEQESGTDNITEDKNEVISAVKNRTPRKINRPAKIKTSEPRTVSQKQTNLEELPETFPLEIVENDQIKELRKKIEDQKLTLTALEVENSILKDNFQAKLIEGFDSISEVELKDIKEFIKTYVKGLETN